MVFNTIHGAKGLAYAAVLLAPPNTLRVADGRSVLDDCIQGLSTEPRRILYVGASWAEKLLAIGAGPNATRIMEMLEASGVSANLEI